MAEKSGFILYMDQYAPIAGLSFEQKGRLLDAFFRFNAGEEPALDDPLLVMAFAFFRQTFTRDSAKYELKCLKNRENIAKRYARDTTVPERMPSNTAAANQRESKPDSNRGSAGSDSNRIEKGIPSASASPGASPDAARGRGRSPSRPDDSGDDSRDDSHASAPCYETRKKRRLAGKRLESFNRFWRAFAYAKGKAEAADAWLDIPGLTNALVDAIVAAAGREAAARPGLVAKGRSPKWAQGWLAARRWEDGDDEAERVPTLDEILRDQGL